MIIREGGYDEKNRKNKKIGDLRKLVNKEG